MCGYQIQQLYNNWMEGDITTILNESNRHFSSLNDVPFPGITVCSDMQLQNLDNNLTILNQTLDKLVQRTYS